MRLSHPTLIVPAFALVLALLATCPQVGAAQEGPKTYRALIAAGLEEYELHHYEEAMSLFERAHQLEPSARTLRGMGMASYQARRYVLAINYLKAALEDPRKPLTEQFRREVRAALEASRGFIGTVDLSLEPSDATLTLDGEPIALLPGEPLALDPGEHELVATAPGYRSESHRVMATSGRRGQLAVRLAPEASTQEAVAVVAPSEPAPVTPEPPPPAEPKAPAGLKALTIGGFSLAVVGAVAGAVTGVKALSEERDLAKLCPDHVCLDEDATKLNHAKRLSTASTVSVAIAGAGAVAGLIGLILWVRHNKRASDRAINEVALRPVLWATGAGVQGRF